MSQKLPILISVPHGGDEIPPEIRERVALTKKDIFDDSDALTGEIYAFQNDVMAYIDTSIARAFVDLNRAPSDRPPENPDGVVKTATVNRCSVYKKGLFPNEPLIQILLQNYYFPYHKIVDELQSNRKIKLALDCHSMLANSPSINKNPEQPRPLICLSNRGDENGNPTKERGTITCPPEWMRLMAKCFRTAFKEEPGEVKINDPFYGGYIIQSHSKNTAPWMQVEINRKLYLAAPYFNEDTLTVMPERISELRMKILTVLRRFLNKLEINTF